MAWPQKSEVAKSVPFDNSTNSFTSQDVQAAIEEARNSGIGAIIPFVFVTTGNTSDKWLGHVLHSSVSNTTPWVVPQDTVIKGITFMNIDDDVDIDICIYKNGTLVYTESIRNKRYKYNVGINGPTLLQGDRIGVFLKKVTGGTGDSTAQDPMVTIYCKFAAEVAATGGAQYGV